MAVGSDPRWRVLYRKQLDMLFKSGALERVIDNLPENSCLMCFESDPRDCHRGILAAYLNEKGLALVQEFKPEDKPKPGNTQLFLL
jgi:hypothetical protein